MKMGWILVIFSIIWFCHPVNAEISQEPGTSRYLWGDFDNDGLKDIFTLDQAGNRYFRNLGDGEFRDETGLAFPNGAGRGVTGACGDYDRDGWADLFLFHEAGFTLFQNDRLGRFADVTKKSGLNPDLRGEDILLEDYDGDGFKDVLVQAQAGDRIYHNLGDGRFEEINLPSTRPSAGAREEIAGTLDHPLPDMEEGIEADHHGKDQRAGDITLSGTEPGEASGRREVNRGRGSFFSAAPDLLYKDAFITPDAGDLLNGFGGFIGGALPNNYDWAIGNRCPSPPSASTTPDIVFSTHNGSVWGEKVRITTNGRVGIGTTDPEATLDIFGPAVSTKGQLKITDPAGDDPFMSFYAGGTYKSYLGYSNGVAYWGSADGSDMAIMGGDVGIGTAGPTCKLHLSSPSSYFGMMTIENSNPGDNEASIAFKEGSDAGGADLWLAGVGGWTNTNDFVIGRAGARFLIEPDGDVEFFGTLNPYKQLDVYGPINLINADITSDNHLYLRTTSQYSTISFHTTVGTATFSRMQIDADGDVGIGLFASSSPANILTVEQYSTTDPIADSWGTYSSRRWKKDIRPIEGALDKVKNLRGVRFHWEKTGQPDIGLIAEEVGRIIPEVVAYEENGQDAKSLDYARLVALLIEAVKEQQGQIDVLKSALSGRE